MNLAHLRRLLAEAGPLPWDPDRPLDDPALAATIVNLVPALLDVVEVAVAPYSLDAEYHAAMAAALARLEESGSAGTDTGGTP